MIEAPLSERVAAMTIRNAKEVLGFYLHLKPEQLANKKILNVGAGGTDLEKDLVEKFGVKTDVVNIDLAYNPTHKSWLWFLLWKLPAKLYPKNAVQADMCFLPFPDDHFDISISTASLSSHWIRDDRASTALLELCRVTKNEIYISPVLERDKHLIEAQKKMFGSRPKFGVEISDNDGVLKLRRLNYAHR